MIKIIIQSITDPIHEPLRKSTDRKIFTKRNFSIREKNLYTSARYHLDSDPNPIKLVPSSG